MNSKMIAIIAVIAMCGAALVGVGYAYTATMQESGNSIASDAVYITVKDKEGAASNVISWDVGKVVYNTVWNGTTFEYIFSASENVGWSEVKDGEVVTGYTNTFTKEINITLDTAQADSGDTFTIEATPGAGFPTSGYEIVISNNTVISGDNTVTIGLKVTVDKTLSSAPADITSETKFPIEYVVTAA